MKRFILGCAAFTGGMLAAGFAAAATGIYAHVATPIAFALATIPVSAFLTDRVLNGCDSLIGSSDDPDTSSTLRFGLSLFTAAGIMQFGSCAGLITGLHVARSGLAF